MTVERQYIQQAIAWAALATGLATSGMATAQDAADDIFNKFQAQLDAHGYSVTRSITGGEQKVLDRGLSLAAVGYQEQPEDMKVEFNIEFDYDSAALRSDQKPRLLALCNAMKKADDIPSFRVLGHSDAAGPPDYNKQLSELRAREVKRHLVTDCGLPGERLVAYGLGEEHLLDESEPLAAANRRVEFQVGY